MLDTRAAGLFLHLTSLPGPHGNGDVGPAARGFAEFLARAGHRWWQLLPVGPAGAGHSPYSGVSAFAGNPMLISLTDMQDVLGLDNSARMNVPGKAEGNWAWRLSDAALTESLAEQLRQLACTYGRDTPATFIDR